MEKALKLAQVAADRDEVPVGALIVHNGQIIAQSFNQKDSDKLATSHAEILAIQEASKNLGQWRLNECELYISLEPCLMCTGAIISSRIKAVIYGASDPKGGAMGSLYSLHKDSRLNHQPECISGVLEEQCGQVLKDFFKLKRKS